MSEKDNRQTLLKALNDAIERLLEENERLREENERLRELMRRLVEYAEPGDYGDMVVDIDDFNAIEKEVGDE